eukprot:15174757-Alexandrium_andersonii.AAC.1
MASPSFLLGSLRCSPWPSSGQRGSACAASVWCRSGGADLHVQSALLRVRAWTAQNTNAHAPSPWHH